MLAGISGRQLSTLSISHTSTHEGLDSQVSVMSRRTARPFGSYAVRSKTATHGVPQREVAEIAVVCSVGWPAPRDPIPSAETWMAQE